jgi:hypothetical protein
MTVSVPCSMALCQAEEGKICGLSVAHVAETATRALVTWVSGWHPTQLTAQLVSLAITLHKFQAVQVRCKQEYTSFSATSPAVTAGDQI